jgi:uncharacterized protein YggE
MHRQTKLVSALMLAAMGLMALSACAAPAQAATGTVPVANVAVQATTTPADQPHTNSVTGVGVQTRDTDPTKAVSANTDKMTAIIAALKAHGIDSKDIQTTNFSVSAQQNNDPQTGLPRGPITFIVDNTVVITIRDLSKVGQILSASIDAGANNIYGVSFSVADQTALEAQARDKAMADAKARAMQLAKDAGVTLDAPMSISENSSGPTPYFAKGFAANAAPSAAVPVQTGQEQVQLQVNVVYLIH